MSLGSRRDYEPVEGPVRGCIWAALGVAGFWLVVTALIAHLALR